MTAGGVQRTVVAAATGIMILGAAAARADAGPAPDADAPALAEQRHFSVAPPWWRRVLAAPEQGLDGLAWPVKRAAFWAEDANLPARVQDALYFNDERTAGWFPNFDFGGEISAGAGLRFFHHDLGPGARVDLSTLLAYRNLEEGAFEEGRVFASAFVPRVAGGPVDLAAEVFFQADEDEDLFVRTLPDGALRLGTVPRESEQSTYAFDQVRGLIQADVHPVERLTVGLAFRPLWGDVGQGEGGEPPTPTTVDGFGGPAVLLGGGPIVEWDGRDAPVRPRAGWYTRAAGGYWDAVEGGAPSARPYRYGRYGGEIHRYQPTFRTGRILVLRAALDRVEPFGDATVPFWDLPVLDEDHLLRAFDRNRFRDRGALAFNVEYRYPIWDTWDGFLFLDEGQVFRNYSDIAGHRFEWSTGAGARFYTAQGFLFRVQLAVGEEDRNFQIGLQQEF